MSSLLSGVPYCELRERFGEEFFGLCFEENERVLRAVGGNLQDFFNGFDAILEHIRTSTGRRASSESPSFQCKDLREERGIRSLDKAGGQRGHGGKGQVLLLHCFNPAPVVGLIMPGLIRAVASRIFHSEVEVEEVPPLTPLLPVGDTETVDGDSPVPVPGGRSPASPPASPPSSPTSPSPFLCSVPTVCLSFQIQERFPPSAPSFPKATSGSFKRSSRLLSTDPGDLRIGLATFCRAFPFHLVLGARLELLQLGEGLRRQARLDPHRSVFFRDCFEIVSPKMEPSFQGILLRLASPFTIRTRPDATGTLAGTKEKVPVTLELRLAGLCFHHHLNQVLTGGVLGQSGPRRDPDRTQTPRTTIMRLKPRTSTLDQEPRPHLQHLPGPNMKQPVHQVDLSALIKADDALMFLMSLQETDINDR